MKLIIKKGDNLFLLKEYPDDYFDSVCTDSPYGLGAEPNAIKLLQDWLDHGYHEINGQGFMNKKWDAFVPQPALWREVFRVLKPGGHLISFFGTRTYDWGVLAIRLAGFEIRDMFSWIYGEGFPKSLNIDKAYKSKYGEDFEHEFAGYGTALKPATEPIVLARKPFKCSVIDNISSFGTGGINIDGCRIEFIDEKDLESATYGTGTNILGGNYVGSQLTDGRKNIEADPKGRFPANVILDPFTASLLDEQTGTLTSGKPSGIRKAKNNIYGPYNPGSAITGYGDSGGASRFFYCAKASAEERNLGLEDFELKTTNDGRNIPCDAAFQRGITERNNHHPTVKPIMIMRWLLRLVTPKGGKCVDPFAGSGTTGCAAYFEDIDEMVLMELDEDGTYIPIIEARTAYWSKEKNRFNYLENIKSKPVEDVKNQLSMFL